MRIDDETLERVIEQITREVLILVEDKNGHENSRSYSISSKNYVH